jgi:hypothetical protein
MNKIKLLSKLQAFFDSDETKRKKSVEEITGVLQKLKIKQLKTKKKLSQCTNDEFKKALLLEFDVITAQIEKGERFLKELVDSRIND